MLNVLYFSFVTIYKIIFLFLIFIIEICKHIGIVVMLYNSMHLYVNGKFLFHMMCPCTHNYSKIYYLPHILYHFMFIPKHILTLSYLMYHVLLIHITSFCRIISHFTEILIPSEIYYLYDFLLLLLHNGSNIFQ